MKKSNFLKVFFQRLVIGFRLLQVQGKRSDIVVLRTGWPVFKNKSIDSNHLFIMVYNEKIGVHIGAGILFDFRTATYTIGHYYFPTNDSPEMVVLEDMKEWMVPNCMSLARQKKPGSLKSLLRGESMTDLFDQLQEYFERCLRNWKKLEKVEVQNNVSSLAS